MRFPLHSLRCCLFVLASTAGLAPLSNAAEAQELDEIPAVFAVDKRVDPALELLALDGKRHSLKELRGKPLVIAFWSTRCPWSKAHLARLAALHTKYGERVQFRLVYSNAGELDPGPPFKQVRDHGKEAKIPCPQRVDPGNLVADRFGARTTPQVFVVDARGVLRYAGAFDDDPGGKRPAEAVRPHLARALDALLAGRAVEKKTSRSFGCTIKRVQPDKDSGDEKQG